MTNLNLRAEIYLLLVILLGLALASYAFVLQGLDIGLELLAFAFMSALIGPATVRIGTKIEMTPAFLFSFCALILFGISGAIVVGMANMLASCYLRKKRLNNVKILFNVFSTMIAIFAAGYTFHMVCKGPYLLTNESFLGAVLLATFTFYLVNTFLITGIAALSEMKPFFSLWNEKFIWTAPSYFAGSSFAVAIAFLVDKFGISVIVLSLPPCALIYYFYRFYLNRGEERKKLVMTIKQLMESEEHLRSQHEQLLKEIEDLKKPERMAQKTL